MGVGLDLGVIMAVFSGLVWSVLWCVWLFLEGLNVYDVSGTAMFGVGRVHFAVILVNVFLYVVLDVGVPTGFVIVGVCRVGGVLSTASVFCLAFSWFHFVCLFFRILGQQMSL